MATWLLLLSAFIADARAFVPFQEVRARFQRTEGVVLDRRGETLHETRIGKHGRRLGWVPIEGVSQALKEAVIRSEDRRFSEHGGVDWAALAKAASGNLFSRRKRGGSTISMQLASVIADDPALRRRRRGFGEKFHQITAALDLEKTWTKDQILEAYLNLISFRGELQGIASASRGLFGKEAHGLTTEESLILAALIRSPEAKPADISRRACELGRELGRLGDCAKIEARIARTGLRPGPIAPVIALAPHLAARYLQSQPELRTTLDRRLQAFVTTSLRRHVLSIRESNVKDAAALVLDNRTGEVLAYVGSIGDLSSARHVDGIQARRQAGSTLKPFLYGLAIESRQLTAASLLEDVPTEIAVQGGIYSPRNYDKEFHGNVSVRTALASSLNVPAVRTLSLIGVDSFVRKLENFGMTGLKDAEYYGPSLALGSADITLWELTNAYRSLANGGRWSELSLLVGAKPSRKPHRALSAEAAFVISSILSDRQSRSLTFGLENPLASRFWTAVKTGTSKDMRDNWCVGYSSRYTVGIWVGNFSGEPMWNVSGVSGAGPAWAEIMGELHANVRSRAPRAPKGLLASQGEWFLEGTRHVEAPPAVITRITYPVEGMVIARDPDIPGDLQRVFFETSYRAPELRFRLNGRELGPASAAFAWNPEIPGDYELALVARDGKVRDRVSFRVTGAP